MSTLSKSNYLKGRQCGRRLWLTVHEPPEPEFDPDEVWEMREEVGTEVEKLAESLFPGTIRVLVDHSEEPELRDGGPEIADLLRRTREALRGKQPIAQAFLHADG